MFNSITKWEIQEVKITGIWRLSINLHVDVRLLFLVLYFLGSQFEHGRSVLTRNLLDPVAVHFKCCAVKNLPEDPHLVRRPGSQPQTRLLWGLLQLLESDHEMDYSDHQSPAPPRVTTDNTFIKKPKLILSRKSFIRETFRFVLLNKGKFPSRVRQKLVWYIGVPP